MDDDLRFALELADLADGITVERFRAADLVVHTKPDLTPVSEADRAAEQALRKRIADERPGHGVVGEEYGADGADATARWILDPIDGTKNYVRGIPVWGTLIALQVAGRGTVGVVSAPALGRRWWAARGRGAFAGDPHEGAAGGRPIGVSAVATLGDAQLAYSSVSSWAARGLEARLLDLERRCWRGRGFGDFWMHVLVAEGACDVAVEPEVSLWDLAAVQVIVEEAGGRFTDLTGVARPDGGSAVASNGLLHDQVLAVLQGR
jgi:histidinol-phosphatase